MGISGENTSLNSARIRLMHSQGAEKPPTGIVYDTKTTMQKGRRVLMNSPLTEINFILAPELTYVNNKIQSIRL